MRIWQPLFESTSKLEEKIGNSYSYHCVQLNLGPCDFFDYFQEYLQESDLFHEIHKDDAGQTYDKYGRENEPHITLCYGLKNEKDYEPLKKYISTLESFPIYLGKTGFFRDTAKPYCVRICEIDDKTNKLHELNSFIRKNFDVHVTYLDYNPHLTIAYCKPSFGIRDGGRHIYQGHEILVNQFHWSHIDGRKLTLPLGK